MARFRTFKNKVDKTEPEDDDKRVKVIKRKDLAFDIFFDENKKLYSFYLMSLMTHSFVGVPLHEDTFHPETLRLIFNTANAMIKHMDVRCNAETRNMILRLALPLSAAPQSFLNDFLAVYKPSTNEVLISPILTKKLSDSFDWGLIDKIRREFAVLERVGNVVGEVEMAFLYEILWYYYYDEFSPNGERHTQLIKERSNILF